MGTILTTSATMMCPHGGTVSATVGDGKRATAGDPILAESDTFIISGCPFMTGSNPHPCVSIRWIAPAVKVTARQSRILTTDSQGLCLAADQVPQGPPTLVAAQSQAAAQGSVAISPSPCGSSPARRRPRPTPRTSRR